MLQIILSDIFTNEFLSFLTYLISLLISFVIAKTLSFKSFQSLIMIHVIISIILIFCGILDYFYLLFALLEIVLIFKTNIKSGESLE